MPTKKMPDESIALRLNPRFINSALRSQAGNINKTMKLSFRKLGCLLEAISKFTLKHGSQCYACTATLLNEFKNAAPKYGVRPIKERALRDYLSTAESLNLIEREHQADEKKGITHRLITINLTGLKVMFKGVYNLALSNATKHHYRQNLPTGRPDVSNANYANNGGSSTTSDDPKICRQRSKDLSKEKEIKIKGSLPSDRFFLKFFGQNADEVKSLQVAAKGGKLNGLGAKRLIKLHHEHGYELAKGFIRYLRHLIAKDKRREADRAEFEAFIERTNP